MHHGASLDIKEHFTDTGGVSDHVFALCRLLGYRFVRASVICRIAGSEQSKRPVATKAWCR